jgi:putative hemolysin
MKVIEPKEFESFSCFFRGKKGHNRAEFVMRMLAIDKVNWVYDHSYAYRGAEFTTRLLNDVGVDYIVGNPENLSSLQEGAFITVSNHPYGGLDGIMLIDLFARIRPDYKFMVNKMLSLIKTLDDNFISVIPTGNKKTGVSAASLRGVRETISHLRDGHPVGFFPSGAVSDFSLRDMRIRDRKWQESILHVISSAKVPIVPVRFFDRNSDFFYFLGLINWRIRSLRLPSEVFNKRGRHPRIAVGKIISVSEQERFENPCDLGVFLRRIVYEMPLPVNFVPRDMLISLD